MSENKADKCEHKMKDGVIVSFDKDAQPLCPICKITAPLDGVKRWDIGVNHNGCFYSKEADDGYWVHIEDHEAALKAKEEEIVELKEIIDQNRIDWKEVCERNKQLKDKDARIAEAEQEILKQKDIVKAYIIRVNYDKAKLTLALEALEKIAKDDSECRVDPCPDSSCPTNIAMVAIKKIKD